MVVWPPYTVMVEFCKNVFADLVLRMIVMAGMGNGSRFNLFQKSYLRKNEFRLRYPKWSVYAAINR